MLETKFYKDLNHNYLILKCADTIGESKYQSRMLEENRMRHLLPCSIRNINSESYIYYEISSRQNITGLFKSGTLECGQLLRLLESIRDASKETEDFLLDNTNIILHPDYIYANPETKEYFFLYYPGKGEREDFLMELARFLVDRADRSSESTVEITYKIYEMIEDDKFFLPEILRLFEDTAAAEEAVDSCDDNINMQEEWVNTNAEERACEEATPEYTYEEEEMPGFMAVAGVLSAVCLLAAIGIVCVCYFFHLTSEETILAVSGAAVLIILAAFLFLSFLKNFFGRKAGASKKEVRKKIESEVGMKDTHILMPSAGGRNAVERQAYPNEKEEAYGDTVFLESAAYRKENKLYGTNKGNKYHIDLNKLPLTMGKMAGSVDFVVKDSTISRIHARFTEKNNQLYVTDLNSTNGTFKNGLRLDPNETVAIEKGDELRFGKMSFCFR